MNISEIINKSKQPEIDKVTTLVDEGSKLAIDKETNKPTELTPVKAVTGKISGVRWEDGKLVPEYETHKSADPQGLTWEQIQARAKK